MKKLREFITSFDVFSEPVSLNYKGETSYKTVVGAFFSISIKIFLIIYATQQMLALINYDSPQITNVSL